ncbi:MAG: CHASE domain-containing protein [Rhodocyclaceae bacterium]|jgi:diguanylate cyclase (GGDEF)-like protein/PAS domain S-box-containing protein|nr:CHASE domain-containing protein [Rhodocyclaceae bacterium]
MKNRIELLLHHKATAWVVLALSLAMTLLAWVVAHRYIQKDATERFNAAVQLARHSIEERMAAYESILRAGAGLIGSSTHVSRNEWRFFVESLQLKTTYPGIQGLGYAVVVPAAGKAALEKSIRDEGYPDFVIDPAGARDRYSAIIYLEPFDWRNQRAFGYDMLSEPVRREAMERAAATGRAAMSGRVTLVQETDENVQPGTLLYLPIYRKDLPTGTPEERLTALSAFIYSPFRIGDLMNGILGPGDGSLHFDLYDGAEAGEDHLMYCSRRARSTGPRDPSMHVARQENAQFGTNVPIEVAGRVWTLRFTSSSEFESAVHSIQPALIAAAGMVANLLLFFVLFSIARNSRLLAREKRRFESAVESAPIAMVMVDEDGWIELVNATFEKMFGYGRRELIGRKIEVLLPASLHHQHAAYRSQYLADPALRQMGKGRELYGLRKDGSRFAVEVGLSLMRRATGRHVIATVADITERKQQVEALKEREARYRGVVETSPDGFWATNPEGQLIVVNDAYCRMSGYSREELLAMHIPDLEANEKPEETAAHIERIYREGFDRFETVHRRRDGSLWPAEITVSIIPSVGELFVFVRDLTTLKTLEAERARNEARIRNLAFHDPLTGLPNRRLLIDRLRQTIAAARRSRKHGALLFIDLDNFKQVNDTLGHEAGDQLLIEVARRLDACTREEDTVARLGGDEFVVMLSGLAESERESMQQVRLTGEKILAALNQPYRLGEQDHDNTPSIGATLFRDEEDVDAILRQADAAMYHVKSSGRNAMNFHGDPQPADRI